MLDIISLFDCTGRMVSPWAAAGFSTLTVDIKAAHHDGPSLVADISTATLPAARVVFAFPPCTHLAASGARWWKGKGPEVLTDALALVSAARVATAQAHWYLIENPVGRLSTYWRAPDWSFDPWEFAGYNSDPAEDAYTKRTCIWGNIPKPIRRPVDPVDGSWVLRFPPSPDRAHLRSVTPQGFAHAIFQTLSPMVRAGKRAPQQQYLGW